MKTRLTLVSCLIAVSCRAQSSGTFTATGSMTTARLFHTAALLADGRVLIAGGSRLAGSPPEYEPLASAELYGPSTGVFTPTGDMFTAHSSHSAALLPDGRVLITGGGDTAELYDPSTGTFTNTIGVPTAERGIAAVLKNGNVLIAGITAQLYDPVTNSLAFTGSYIGPFYDGPYFYTDSAPLLPDGRVLVVGNASDSDGWNEHEEVYDPVTGTFKVASQPLTTALGSYIWGGHSTTLLPNGKVLLAGGDNADFGYFSKAELYDPATDTITATANMTLARASHTATLLPDGTVLIAGGGNDAMGSAASAESYNSSTAQFAAAGSMTIARAAHTATLLPDGRVLIAGGGVPYSTVITTTAELYTPASLKPSPGLFSLSGNGTGQGAIWHADTGKIASSANPATAEDVAVDVHHQPV
jgi:hypothetical protein